MEACGVYLAPQTLWELLGALMKSLSEVSFTPSDDSDRGELASLLTLLLIYFD